MATINTDGLTPMQLGRLNKALDSLIRIDGVVTTWRASIAPLSGEKRVSDGMASWSRTRFNRMDYAEQAAYEARLKAKRVYLLAIEDPKWGTAWREVPKVIFDAVSMGPEVIEPGTECTEADYQHLFGVADQTLIPGVTPVPLTTRQIEAERQRREARQGHAPLPSGGLWDETAQRQQELF